MFFFWFAFDSQRLDRSGDVIAIDPHRNIDCRLGPNGKLIFPNSPSWLSPLKQ